jgi:hypothetical protein
MEERIDFVLEPGVIIFAILFLVGINLLLAAVIYPYFRGGSDAEEAEDTEVAPEPEEDFESVSASADEEAFEQRVDEFLEDVRSEKVE